MEEKTATKLWKYTNKWNVVFRLWQQLFMCEWSRLAGYITYIFIVKIVWISRRWMSPHHECRLGFRPVIANNQRQLAWPKRGQLEKRQLEVKTANEVAYARSTRFEHNTERDRHLPSRNKNAFQFQIDCQSLIIVIIICFLLLFRCCCCCCCAVVLLLLLLLQSLALVLNTRANFYPTGGHTTLSRRHPHKIFLWHVSLFVFLAFPAQLPTAR